MLLRNPHCSTIFRSKTRAVLPKAPKIAFSAIFTVFRPFIKGQSPNEVYIWNQRARLHRMTYLWTSYYDFHFSTMCALWSTERYDSVVTKMKVIIWSSKTCHSMQFCTLIPNIHFARRLALDEGAKNRENHWKLLKMLFLGLLGALLAFLNGKS